MTTTTKEEQFLSKAISLATDNVYNSGGPFGALIVTLDGRSFEGANRVTANNDPTAHAEVMAIRNACASLETFDLSGSTLYTSCEPCPLCLSAALWARVDAVVFAADRNDAARAGFDDAVFYDYFATPVEDRSMPVRQYKLTTSAPVPASSPFEAWNSLTARVDY
ncbi:guanine deaminase [Arthrobacter subterraneus]|uniref:Guanine deaminase n=1 Tax=Arthrobacter subterraneus TaxID=335973 RepID=A0A1G8MCE8_9MICC|nr:nucleoside deaminase [Arthrobacter subterraneus]SDI65613.1 guanine deaminase [Arthrobacter subterraneus]